MRLLSTHHTGDSEYIALVDRAGNVSITCSGPSLNTTGVVFLKDVREWSAQVLGEAVVVAFPVWRVLADVLGGPYSDRN